MSEGVPGKSESELAVETFADRMKEIHPNLDREGFRDAVNGYVRDATDGADDGEESNGKESGGEG